MTLSPSLWLQKTYPDISGTSLERYPRCLLISTKRIFPKSQCGIGQGVPLRDPEGYRPRNEYPALWELCISVVGGTPLDEVRVQGEPPLCRLGLYILLFHESWVRIPSRLEVPFPCERLLRGYAVDPAVSDCTMGRFESSGSGRG